MMDATGSADSVLELVSGASVSGVFSSAASVIVGCASVWLLPSCCGCICCICLFRSSCTHPEKCFFCGVLQWFLPVLFPVRHHLHPVRLFLRFTVSAGEVVSSADGSVFPRGRCLNRFGNNIDFLITVCCLVTYTLPAWSFNLFRTIIHSCDLCGTADGPLSVVCIRR